MVDVSTGRSGQENDGYESPLWVDAVEKVVEIIGES
jgi:hypothetical protein